MTLDELVQELQGISGDRPVRDLARHIAEWKSDDRNIGALESMVERFFGNVWIPDERDHARACRLWAAFRDGTLRAVGGMTMNERLHALGLFERFDACDTEVERRVVYGKVDARP